MYDPDKVTDGAPSYGDGEFIELYNPGSVPVDIGGWEVLRADDRSFTIPGGGGYSIAAGGYFLLAANSNLGLGAYGVTADYVWAAGAAGFFLRNVGDTLTLKNSGGTVVSTVSFLEANGWPDAVGASIQLAPTLLSEIYVEEMDAWCLATSEMDSGDPSKDEGTPGSANDACAGVDVDEDGHFTAEEDCDDTEPDAHFDLIETPDDGIDNDCDGIELVTLISDPVDSGYTATNELTNFYIGWDETNLAVGYDFTIETNAIMWQFDLDIPGGETDFHSSRGYSGAYPTDVTHERGIDFMIASYASSELGIFRVTEGNSTTITDQADAVFRTTYLADGSPGFAFVRIPWAALYPSAPGTVEAGATLSIVGMIRSMDNTSPYVADVAPNNGGNPISNYATVVVDGDSDGEPDSAVPTPTPPTPTPTPDAPTITPTMTPPTPTLPPETPTAFPDGDSDGHTADVDCDDDDPAVHPGAPETICNGKDDDCDAGTQDAPDVDGDGYDICGADADCNDGAIAVNPGADEILCNVVDDDCDAGTVDAPNEDGDGYDVCAPEQPGDTDTFEVDCDDKDGTVNPGQSETTCNGKDDDCDAGTQDAPDFDNDSYDICDPADPGDSDERAADCNDNSNTINPGRSEITCNSIDDDCDEDSEDAPDVDGDGFDICGADADCNDAIGTINPGQPETTCNSIDDDCDEDTDDTPDVDGDGYDICGADADCNDNNGNINPGHAEVSCNGLNDDCAAGTVDNPDVDNDGYDICNPADPGADDGRAADCNDNNSAINPGRAEVSCNGLNDDCSASTPDGPDDDGDSYDICGADADCDDDDEAINPGATEVCDGDDNDCDGTTDEPDAADVKTWYLDIDRDGYGLDGSAQTQCNSPGGLWGNQGGDCNDSLASVHPNASEACNDTDDDCDGVKDEDFDVDGDGHFSAALCGDLGDDCNDNNAEIKPGAPEKCNNIDDNCDGVGDATTFDVDGDGFLTNSASCSPSTIGGKPATDCNDNAAAINPSAIEVCDSKDNDCDGKIDDADTNTQGRSSWYPDGDADGYGAAGSTALLRCVQPPGRVGNNTDCDDADADAYPGAPEECGDLKDLNCDGSVADENNDNDAFIACEDCDDSDPQQYPNAPERCNGEDDDCDGKIDDEDDDVVEPYDWYPDADDDGSRANSGLIQLCVAPDGYISVEAQVDCADADPNRSPLNSETCDEVDNDCDTTVDEGVQTTFYKDADADTYGDPGTTTQACSVPATYVANANDCDDDDATVNPRTPWYPDIDGDEVGANIDPTRQCTQPNGYVRTTGDCADGDADIYPDAPLLCDGKDNDCDGLEDLEEGYDADDDGFLDADRCAGQPDPLDCDDAAAGINPDATDVCGAVDEDCDEVLYDVDCDGYGVAEGDCADGGVDVCAPESPDYDACLAAAAAINPGVEEQGGNTVDEDCDGEVEDVDGDGFNAGDTFADDCDDLNAAINPDAEDVCGAVDDDCDGILYDVDCDGYGVDEGDCDDSDAGLNPGAEDLPGNTVDEDCDGVPYDQDDDGYGVDDNDCKDLDPAINPGVEEIAYDGTDQDCDGVDLTDVDGDGHDAEQVGGDDCDDNDAAINPGADEVAGNDVDEDCDDEAYDVDDDGFGVGENDCDDDNPLINPEAIEACGNAVDENCDGDFAGDCQDVDGDGFSETDDPGDCDDNDPAIYPGAPEQCGDGIDDNCNDLIDENCDPEVNFFSGCSTAGGAADPRGLMALLILLMPAVFGRATLRGRRPGRRLEETPR